MGLGGWAPAEEPTPLDEFDKIYAEVVRDEPVKPVQKESPLEAFDKLYAEVGPDEPEEVLEEPKTPLEAFDRLYAEVVDEDDHIVPLTRARPEPKPISLGFVAIVLSVLIFGTVYHLTVWKMRQANLTRQSNEIQRDAATWLKEAQRSLDTKNYVMAAHQYKRALGYLKHEGATPAKVEAVRTTLAQTYAKAGDFEEARSTWLLLARLNPSLEPAQVGLQKANRELRIVANEKVKEAERVLKTKPKMAISLGNRAVELYELCQGQRAQLGRAHAVVAQAHRDRREKIMAATHYKLAHEYSGDPRFKAELKKLGPVIPRKPKKMKLMRPDPSVVPVPNAPKGR